MTVFVSSTIRTLSVATVGLDFRFDLLVPHWGHASGLNSVSDGEEIREGMASFLGQKKLHEVFHLSKMSGRQRTQGFRPRELRVLPRCAAAMPTSRPAVLWWCPWAWAAPNTAVCSAPAHWR